MRSGGYGRFSVLLRVARRPLAFASLVTPALRIVAPALAADPLVLLDPRVEFEAEDYISNGKVPKACTWPAVTRLKVGRSLCTGTLVHPQVIAYASHCGRVNTATLGESGQGGALSSFSKNNTNRKFDINRLDGPNGEPMDWAFAVLSKPIKGVPIIPFASKGEYAQIMANKAPIAMAGFGHRGAAGKASAQMMWTENRIGETCHGWIQAGHDSKNACPGDSGGPLLAQLPDKSWRVIGIASTLYGEERDGKKNCGKATSYNHYARVRPELLTWFEKGTGLDLTPCYDVDGKVDKSSACKGFFAGDPLSPTGSWSNNCADAKIVDEPKLYPAHKDSSRPTAELTWPKQGAVYGLGQTIEVRVAASDDQELAQVTFSSNGTILKQWDKPPYVFDWKLEDALIMDMRVTARDVAGNEAEGLKLVRITVKEGEEGPEKDPDAKDEEDKGDDKGKGEEDDKGKDNGDKGEEDEKGKDEGDDKDKGEEDEDKGGDDEEDGKDDEDDEDDRDEEDEDNDNEEDKDKDGDDEEDGNDSNDGNEGGSEDEKEESGAKAEPSNTKGKKSGCAVSQSPWQRGAWVLGLMSLLGLSRRRR